MKRFIEGEDRSQSTLFPETLDDYIGEDNSVRVIEVFIDELDLSGLGFDGVNPQATGRPAYHPSVLLKIYLYGYLNRIQSSRRLERETQRNVELMWLTRRLAPDFKTIADFRKDNGQAIRAVCREFVLLCRRLNLFADAMVAIDGSKFKAVNHRDKNFTRAKLKRRMELIEQSLDRYFAQLDQADHQARNRPENSARLEDKIKALKKEMAQLKKLEVRLAQTPGQQISLTDPDARSMKTRGQGIVGYNVQTAVDTKHHLILAHEVTNTGSDRAQLSKMAKQAQAIVDQTKLRVVADRGYYKSQEILACEEAGIDATVPKSQTSGNQSKGLFARGEFRYRAKDNTYRCPANQRMIWRFRTIENGLTLDCYWSSHCPHCAIKERCTTGKYRRIKRWEDEAVLERMQTRLDRHPDIMRLRRQTVEHPYGTLKAWMGATHFQMKTLKRVSTEMSLHVLAYNMKRVMNILGVKPLMEAIQA